MSTPKFIFLQLPPDVAAGTNWEMWSALATAAATLVALGLPLFLHYREIKHRKEEADRASAELLEARRTRTQWVGPMLAGDAMRVQWDLLSAMRAIFEVARTEDFPERAESYRREHGLGKIMVRLRPGSQLLPHDVELLTPDVRLKLSGLIAQVEVLNAFFRRLCDGPFDPWLDRAGLVRAQLVHVATQIVDTNHSVMELMDALQSFLVPPAFADLHRSMARNDGGFNAMLASIRHSYAAENPNGAPRPPG